MSGCGGEHQKSSISTDSGFRDTQVFSVYGAGTGPYHDRFNLMQATLSLK
jgi:hypothetical protein